MKSLFRSGYSLLAVAIISEVFATTMLKFSEGFSVMLPSIAVVAGYALSFYTLALCMKTVPLSLAYAIWSGVGTGLTALIGVWLWNDPFNALTLAGLVLIIGGVILLNSPAKQKSSRRG